MFDKLKGAARSTKRTLGQIANPARNVAIEANYQIESNQLPTLWLLGKTGAGKSSLIRAVTANTEVEIGAGYKPCTQSSRSYDFPSEKPLFRFLDTRGLAEADYDAQADIGVLQASSNAVVLVMKLDDPEQSSVLAALRQVKQSKKLRQILLVHTGLNLVSNPDDRLRCQQHNQHQVEQLWGGAVPAVAVDLVDADADVNGRSDLLNDLGALLPILALAQQREQQQDLEQQSFLQLKNELLWYAGIAGTSDTLPGVGLVSVPLLQAKMLHSLAQHYGVNWGRREMSELFGTLGTGFGIQYAAKLGVRQLVKLLPVYGQTAGAASAAVMSFSTTYAIGRVACHYLFHKCRGEPLSRDALQALYQEAFSNAKPGAPGAQSEPVNKS
ncbi:YcjF family protein [Reinekea sp.]|jgi:uncharacterized protein (DUF697 family)|uniref:YcjF family protein n=1 Tax=Reinekea sp. TaxID=1970455 RepID=UPI002A8026A0|nr:GTPase [Reinekea sp.]